MGSQGGRFSSRIAALATLVLLIACGASVRPVAAASPAPGPVRDPASLVDPFVGTSGGVNTFPGADMPFGMVQWSPDTTPDRTFGGGYEYSDYAIQGFSLTHLSGPGCSAFGDVPILPTTGAVSGDPGGDADAFTHGQETASPGYYAVTADAIRTELTVTTHSGLGRFTFPSTGQADLVFKIGDSAEPNTADQAQVAGGDEVTGSVASGDFCGAPDHYTLYFAVQFQTPFTTSGTWQATSLDPGGTSVKGGQDTGLWVTFDATRQRQVLARVGISYVSVQGAEANAQAEDPSWNFDAVRTAAHDAWNQALGRITLSGGSTTDRTVFYTALYHSLLFPSVYSDADGSYRGFDGQVHSLSPPHQMYANFSGWDIYRSQVQLLALLFPQRASDIAESMVLDGEQGGLLPKWALANGETYIMVGDPAEPILSDLYAFGAHGFDTASALRMMESQATKPNDDRPGLEYWERLGYLPLNGTYGCCNYYGPASTSLEYATDDFATSRLAAALGSPDEALASRAQDWRKLFDGRSGFIEPRLLDGDFVSGFSPSSAKGFVEGDSYQYTPMVPFDVGGLVRAVGGDATFTSRLNSFFGALNAGATSDHAWMGNEPGLEIPWEYDYAGAPWRTQSVVRRIETQLYGDDESGEAGNDDLGEMSSWYVWAALGMYPETPGTAVLTLGSPLFPSATVQLGDGRTLQIDASGAAPGSPFVHGLTLDGKRWTRDWLQPSIVSTGGTLRYRLGAGPDRSWGAAAADAPPSWS